jgi:hypothetical protein
VIAAEIFFIGVIATALADLWQQALKRVAGLPPANWRIVGRWVAGFREGAFFRPAISAEPAVEGEGAIGWTFHYIVGIIYAAMFVAAGVASGERLGLWGALAFGLATLSAPWFLLKPALGLGLFANRAASPWRDFVVTTTTHLAFGLGLYGGSQALLSIW